MENKSSKSSFPYRKDNSEYELINNALPFGSWLIGQPIRYEFG
jgi:hypothetical protein